MNKTEFPVTNNTSAFTKDITELNINWFKLIVIVLLIILVFMIWSNNQPKQYNYHVINLNDETLRQFTMDPGCDIANYRRVLNDRTYVASNEIIERCLM